MCELSQTRCRCFLKMHSLSLRFLIQGVQILGLEEGGSQVDTVPRAGLKFSSGGGQKRGGARLAPLYELGHSGKIT